MTHLKKKSKCKNEECEKILNRPLANESFELATYKISYKENFTDEIYNTSRTFNFNPL